MTNITLYQEIYKQIESETLNIAYHVSLDENQKNVYSPYFSELQLRIYAQIESVLKKKYQDLSDLESKKGNPKYDYDCIPALSLEEKKAYLYWNQYHFKKKLYDDVFKITLKKTDSDGTVKNSNETYKFNNAYQNLRHDFENSIKKFGTLEYLFEALATMFLLVDLSTSKIFAKAEIDNSGNLTGWVSSGTAIRKTFDTK